MTDPVHHVNFCSPTAVQIDVDDDANNNNNNNNNNNDDDGDGDMPNTEEVADHYNARPDIGIEQRKQSSIYHLRNYNNWVKSVMIGRHTARRGMNILDLCCGKGGDFKKFQKAGARCVVAVDIAQESVRHARERYRTMEKASFRATFLAGDCFEERLEEWLLPDVFFDLVSCQFSMHYAFSTEQRVRRLLENVSDRLVSGGIFVATTVDANVLIKRIRTRGTHTIGNDVYRVTFSPNISLDRLPRATTNPFGIAYTFSLEDSVDNVEEYIVHLPTFERLALEYDLEMVYNRNFLDIYEEFKGHRNYRELLYRMKVLDPPSYNLSEQEWAVAHLYLGVVFRKKGDPVRTSPPPYPATQSHDDIVEMKPV